MFLHGIVRWKISAISFFYTNFMSNFGYFTLFMEWIWYIRLSFHAKIKIEESFLQNSVAKPWPSLELRWYNDRQAG